MRGPREQVIAGSRKYSQRRRRTTMDFFDSRYFRINKFFLSILGLWPYQEPTTKFIILLFAIVGIMVAMLPQVIYFLEYWYHIDEMFELMPTLCGTIICFGKLAGLTCNAKKFKELIDRTHEDWINMSKNQDRQTLIRYAETARKFTIVYSTSIGGIMSCYVPLPLITSVYQDIKSPNETNPRKLLHHAEYFVSSEKYYYVLMFVEIHAYMISAVIVLAADNIYFLLLEHVCGMQSVLCHRLENIIMYDELQCVDNDLLHRNNKISQRVQRCIQLDNRIRSVHINNKNYEFRYLEMMETTFATSILADIGLGFIFHISTCIMIVIHSGGLAELARYASFLILQSSRFFLISWTGQEVIDHSSNIPTATYNAMWYRMPPEIQKNLMLLIVRSQKFSQLTVAKFYIINLENFSEVMKTSVTYCTVMISIR